MNNYLNEKKTELTNFLSECREDMHEPDEQGITARVVGNKLDNALGEDINPLAVRNGWQEFVVILENDKHQQIAINLATLIALAKR